MGFVQRLSARVGSMRWVVALSALTAVTALSIDMSLPAQPAIARDLGVSADVAQLTLSLFLVGYAFGQMLFGYLSDAFGRRPVLLTGLLVFTAGGAACTVCHGVAPETLALHLRTPVADRKIATSVARFLGAPGTLAPTLLVCLSFAGQFAFISDSPFVLIQGFGIPASRFGLYFGATALALMAGAMLGRHLLRTRPPVQVLVLGGATLFGGGLAVELGVHVPRFGAFGLVVPMVVYFVGLGLSGPSATAIAMDPVPRIAGTASATIGFLQMLSGALAGYATTRLGGSDPHVLGAVEASVGGLAAIVVAVLARGKT